MTKCRLVALLVALVAILFNIPSLAADPAKGKQVYQSFCWVCHGKYGRGDGPAGANLEVKPRDLTDYKYMSAKSDQELFQWISGRNPNFHIPAHSEVWRETLTDRAVRDVMAYVRTLSSPTAKGSVTAGKDLFNTYCWVCHGRTARGDGPAATRLKAKPQDLTDPNFRAGMDADKLFASISSGPHKSAYMPIWNVTLSQQEIWDLVEYIKSLRVTAKGQQKG